MVQINFAQKQVNAKIVFYGPGMSGKTTNLEVIHQRAPVPNKGELTSISTDGDRTLFFDFMPLDLGTVAGMRTCFQIYTVPGQVYYNSTRKLVLQGVDGVVFVADSSASMMEENLESIRNLEQNLNEYGKSITSIPVILQYNKRDLPDALPVEELNRVLNPNGFPIFEAVANTGQGVFPTLKALAAKVLESIHGGAKPATPGQAPAVAPAAPAPHPAAPVASAPAPKAAPAPVAVGAAQSTAAPAQGAGGAGRSLTQTAYQRGFQRPAAPANAALPPVPTFSGKDPLARTNIQAPPPQARPAPAQPAQQPQASAAPISMAQPQAQQGHGGLSMVQPNSGPGARPLGGGHAPRGATGPGAARPAAAAPRSLAGERAAQPARPAAAAAPAARPRASARPAPAAPAAAPKQKSKALLYSGIFVVAALGIGFLVAHFVFSKI
jgi:hypothetical protein